jgi:hypothetical protein
MCRRFLGRHRGCGAPGAGLILLARRHLHPQDTLLGRAGHQYKSMPHSPLPRTGGDPATPPHRVPAQVARHVAGCRPIMAKHWLGYAFTSAWPRCFRGRCGHEDSFDTVFIGRRSISSVGLELGQYTWAWGQIHNPEGPARDEGSELRTGIGHKRYCPHPEQTRGPSSPTVMVRSTQNDNYSGRPSGS